jgi:signal transduction histidine kinase
VITGATSTLLEHDATLEPGARRELIETAHEEAERLNRLVQNLLDMTRVASGAMRSQKEWHPFWTRLSVPRCGAWSRGWPSAGSKSSCRPTYRRFRSTTS